MTQDFWKEQFGWGMVPGNRDLLSEDQCVGNKEKLRQRGEHGEGRMNSQILKPLKIWH